MGTEKKTAFREYAFTTAFLGLGGYQLSKPDYWEFTMYLMAAAAFALMGLIKDGYFPKHKSLADTVSWVLIICTGIFFLYIVVTDT